MSFAACPRFFSSSSYFSTSNGVRCTCSTFARFINISASFSIWSFFSFFILCCRFWFWYIDVLSALFRSMNSPSVPSSKSRFFTTYSSCSDSNTVYTPFCCCFVCSAGGVFFRNCSSRSGGSLSSEK